MMLIVGDTSEVAVGTAFFQAAQRLGLDAQLIDAQAAYQAPFWQWRLNWHLRGRYPSRLKQFGQELVDYCRIHQPKWLLTSGISPVDRATLDQLSHLGVQTLNFLTDDPWNPALRAPWFLDALPHYDTVFSTRRRNLADLSRAGCQAVKFLPFGYNPGIFYPDSSAAPQKDQLAPDVFFAGAADRDRVPYMNALIQAGMRLSLYGRYWERFRETKAHAKGVANTATIRAEAGRAKLSLCLVRRANRDGHCMRTFEIPAIGSCMLTEDTPEHREIFGAEGEAVVYFTTIPEMVEKARGLLQNQAEREKLANAAHQRITEGGNTYRDRLKVILSV